MHPTLEGSRYDPEKHRPRCVTTLKQKCEIAEQLSIKLADGANLSRDEKVFIADLEYQNVHAHQNPFHYAPMGHNNDVYKANPPDLLHLFCAGLFKALAGWILTIISTTSTDKQKALFDSRIHNFPYIYPMPHLNWSYFVGGILKYNQKSKSERLHATGAFGGFRSSSFISMLFQIYYAIGNNDDVITSSVLSRTSSQAVPRPFHNVRAKILKAIECSLDAYFDCKRKEWRPEYLSNFQAKLSSLSVHVLLLWDLKQSIVNPNESKITVNKMRNIHKLEHLSMYIAQWGSLIHLDTGTFESYHKIGTTGVWGQTSKRHGTLIEEMTAKIIMRDYQRICKVRDQIVNNELNPIVTTQDGVEFRRILNMTAYGIYIKYDYSEDVDIEDEIEWISICPVFWLNSQRKFTAFLKKYKFHELIEEYYGVHWDLTFNQKFQLDIVPGIFFRSDDESQMGSGTMYACNRYNKNDSKDDFDKSRHDFVFINYFGQKEAILSRIMVFMEVSPINSTLRKTDKATRIILLVQQLIKVPQVAGSILGDIYQYASEPGHRTEFKFDIVPVQAILRPAFVVPVFREAYNTTHSKPEDKFWVLDRKFFDRSGWASDFDANELQTPNQQEAYIQAHQIGNRILEKSSNKAQEHESTTCEKEQPLEEEYDSDVYI